VGLLVRTSQAWKTSLSPGCIKKDSWQFFSFISFLYLSPYQKNSLYSKTHIHIQLGIKENPSVSNIILKKIFISHPTFYSLIFFAKTFSKNIPKTANSLPPTNDLQNPNNQSTLSKIATCQSHHSLIYVNNTLLDCSPNSIPNKLQSIIPKHYQFFKIRITCLQQNITINKTIYSKDDPSQEYTLGSGQHGLCLEKFCSWSIFSNIVIRFLQSTPTLNTISFKSIIIPYTIYCTKSRIWKVDVNIPFMSLEANPYTMAAVPSCDWTKPE
jgi:hypothetical protein